jgi:sialate O-acetylesterase
VSKFKQIGTIIRSGPSDWAIIQQEDGFGTIELSGTWDLEGESAGTVQAYARIVREEDGSVAVDWVRGEMGPDREWRVTLKGIPAGGLYRIVTCLQPDGGLLSEWAVRGDMVHHIGIGDLWVIAGQSNAAGYGRGPIHDPPEIGVHLLRNSGQWGLASHPFNESTASIHMENRETSNPGHSPFLAFGKVVHRETGIPIGFLQTALGGSHLKSWNPEEEGTLYRNMRSIIAAAGNKVRGVLWYQGCSDCSPVESVTYLDRFASLVDHLRRDLRSPDLPFFTVQLNRLTDLATEEGDRAWGTVREAQRQAALRLPHVYVIPALDCPLSDNIHNSSAGNLLIGERMANSALAFAYEKRPSFRAPEIHSAKVYRNGSSSVVRLEFDHVQGYLTPIGSLADVFSVEDEEGFVPISAATAVSRNGIELALARIPGEKAFLHAAYETNPTPFLPLDTGTYMPILAFYNYSID